MEFTAVLFDLDGTLTDPAEGITNSVVYALKKMGIEPPSKKELLKFIGPPLAESFEKFYSFSKEDALKAVDFYREYFAPKGIFENRIIEGMDSLVKNLKSRNKKIILATSKPKVFADEILKHFNFYDYFDLTVGSNLDGSLTDKAEVIALALEKAQITELSSVVMVGDRCHDMIGAVKNKITPVGVTFGYGSKEELLNSGAKYIADTVSELEDILFKTY